MANHQIPRTAKRTVQLFGIDADGNVVVCSVYRHTRQGHALPMFYIVQYREQARRIDRTTRVTRELSGPSAPAKLAQALAEVGPLLERSRARAARRADRLVRLAADPDPTGIRRVWAEVQRQAAQPGSLTQVKETGSVRA